MNEDNLSRLKAFFYKAIRDAHYQLGNYQIGNEIKYEFIFRGYMIMMRVRGAQALAKVNELLVEDEYIGKRFSQKTLKREVQSLLGEIVVGASDNVQQTEQKLEAFIAKLENRIFSSQLDSNNSYS